MPVTTFTKFMPSGVVCPECGKPAKRVSYGVGEYWTTLYKGQKYVCTVCGLEFVRERPIPRRRKLSYKEQARREAETVVVGGMEAGKKYELVGLQQSARQAMDAYYQPLTEKDIRELEEREKKPAGKKRLPTKWRFVVPIIHEKNAELIWWSLDEEGFEVDVNIIEHARKKDIQGNPYKYFELIAYRPEGGVKARPPQTVIGTEKVIPTTKNVVTLSAPYRCTRDGEKYNVGDKVLVIGGYFYCPRDGGYLEPL